MKFIVSTLTLATCLAVGMAATEDEFWSTVTSQVAAMHAQTVVMASNPNNTSHSKVGKVNRSMGREKSFWVGDLGGRSPQYFDASRPKME